MAEYLFEELLKFTQKEKISMHIPGHKGGRGIGAYFKENAFNIDVTELSETDDLQNPGGILKTAQDKCAEIFGAEETLFLTGGSSLGLRASVMGCMPRGGRLLVDRTCHRSVISAVALGGIEPVFVSPEFDGELGLYAGISPLDIAEALKKNPDICGAVLTSPTYYGICSDIAAISEILHQNGKFLIVDEAHGAHFAFNGRLPQTALSLGADICVQSAHKTLPALGQCSFLHIAKNARIDKERVIRTLRLIQSTSPSYLLMSSLDRSARYMKSVGGARLDALIDTIEDMKAYVRSNTNIDFIGGDMLKKPCDLTRLVIDFGKIGISGNAANEILSNKYGIYSEMSDFRYVVMVPTIANTKRDIAAVGSALAEIGKGTYGSTAENNLPLPAISAAMPPSEALEMQYEKLPIDECEGRISASVLSACPPGAAVLIPGQLIDKAAVEFIKKNDTARQAEVIVR